MPADQPPDLFACFHEAAHAVVGLSFGQAVESIAVDGESGGVLFGQTPEPADVGGLVRVHWGQLCCTVAGEVGELLHAELEESEGRWRSPEERTEETSRTEALMRAFSAAALPYPAGEVGLFLRYAAALTGRDSLVTARLWRSRNGGRPDDGALPVGECDVSAALRHSGWILSLRQQGAFLPGVPHASAGGADGLDDQFGLIWRAELEAEAILKREWHRAEAAAIGLYRRKAHRMTGRQLAALLRSRG